MVAVMLFFRVLVNKHASTGASPAVSVQLLNLRVGLYDKSKLEPLLVSKPPTTGSELWMKIAKSVCAFM